MESSTSNTARKQLVIFLLIAFALPFAMGGLMAYGNSRGFDVSAFSSLHMHYPAAGAILAALITRRGDPLLPKRFYIGYLALTAVLIVVALVSVAVPGLPWQVLSQLPLISGSVIIGILLLTERREKRAAYGLRGGRWKMVALITLLYLALYFARAAIAYLVDGDTAILAEIAQNPMTWVTLAIMPINYFLVLSAFFGEEYGWRYYLQPVLQKRFGMVGGIFLLGVVWGLWHMPLNFFYYTSPSLGLISLTGQLVTCITLGVFYGWAYAKTDNIWTVVILHCLNNNLVPVITGNYSVDVLQNQEPTWGGVLFSLIVSTVLFMGPIFSAFYRKAAGRLPTMDERAEYHHRLLRQQASEPPFPPTPTEGNPPIQ